MAIVRVDEGLIEGEPDRHAICEVGEDDFAVVHKRILERLILVRAIDIANQWLVCSRTQVAAVELQRRVEVKQCHGRNHSFLQNIIQQIAVVVDSLLVDRRPPENEGQNPGPCNAQGIILDAHRSEALDVLLVEVVVLVGDVVFGPVVRDQDLHERRCFPFFSYGTLDLCRGACDSEHEVLGKVVAIRWPEIIPRRKHELTGRHGSWRDRRAVYASVGEILDVGVQPEFRPRRIAVRIRCICCSDRGIGIPAAPSRCR